MLSVTDPANVYSLPMPHDAARDPFVKPRSRGALFVTLDGVVVMIAERRGERILIRRSTSEAVVTRAAAALVAHLSDQTTRDLVVETIDGQPASGSMHLESFRAAGFRRGTVGLRYYRAR